MEVDRVEMYFERIRWRSSWTWASMSDSRARFSLPEYYGMESASRDLVMIREERLTPAAICWRRLVCFFSSSWLKTWSLPGSTLVAALNQ